LVSYSMNRVRSLLIDVFASDQAWRLKYFLLQLTKEDLTLSSW